MKLKPCPFCGGEAEIAVLMGTRYIRPAHKRNCIIRPDTWLISHKPIKQQIKAWNRREPMDKIVEQLEGERNYALDLYVDNVADIMAKTHNRAIEIVKEGGAV